MSWRGYTSRQANVGEVEQADDLIAYHVDGKDAYCDDGETTADKLAEDLHTWSLSFTDSEEGLAGVSRQESSRLGSHVPHEVVAVVYLLLADVKQLRNA